MKKPKELSTDPRLTAYLVLKTVLDDHQPPEELLGAQGALLSHKDMALATALVYEVLRHKSYLDAVITSHLTTGQAPKSLKLALRLGVAQLFFFTRLGDHAVVMETVALAKQVCPGRHGVVNAVLRNLLRLKESGEPWPPAAPRTGDKVRDLATEYSFPPWIVQRWLKQFGDKDIQRLLSASNRATPPTLRSNPLKITREHLQRTLPFDTLPTVYSPWGLSLKNFAGRPEEWEGYTAGHFSVQDEASQLLALIAGPADGLTVADACAGLGGKTLALATVNAGLKTIKAIDRDAIKLTALKKEAKRLGCAGGIKTIARDILEGKPPTDSFDLVLLDPPCSGLGVIRRRPDLKWSKKPSDISRLAVMQLRLLKTVAQVVRPGGRVIYSVCSPNEEEGPQVVRKFLGYNKDFVPLPPACWPDSLRPHLGPEGLLLLPHHHNTDGFFWSVLRRQS